MLLKCYYLCSGYKKAMKHKKINILIFSSLLAITLLQIVWLRNEYRSLENNVYKESNTILIKATRREVSMRFQQAPKGTEIVGITIPSDTKKDELAPEIASLNEGLIQLGFEMSLTDIDSIASDYLKEIDITTPIAVCKINLNTKEVISISNPDMNVNSWGVIKSKIILIRSNPLEGVQLVIASPYKTFLERMGLLILSTFLILTFVICCVVYQIKSILRLKQIFQIREDFTYALIHDMKTPLSSILSVLKFLQSGSLDDRPVMKEKYFQIAESEANHLLTLTNKVLVISKLESGKLEMNKKEILLAPMMKELVENFTAKTSKPVHFTLDLQVEEAYADGEYLKEVISNLIDNAIKYSKESVDIKISSESDKEYTVIKVRDNGLGISIEDQRVIFNKFERASASRRSRKGGATGFGLGLNFVQKVVEAHEGRIIVNSIEGEFAEFIIYLPQIMQSL